MAASDRIDELKKRYDENPRRFFASLANEYRKAGDLEQAISLCQMHLAEQPTNMNGHVVYGQALFEAGRYDEAKGTFETALTLDPENLIALRHLGDIACTNGANDKAREWYERVLDADPRNDEIIALLANLEEDRKRVAIGAPIASVESMGPRETRGEPFKPPQVITPLSTASVASPTPIAPIESVNTLQIPAVSARPASPPTPAPAPAEPPPVSRESLGLLDLTIDVESTTRQPFSDSPPENAEPVVHDEFPSFEDVSLDASLLAAPIEPIAPEAPRVLAGHGDFMPDPFADPFADPAPVELPAAEPPAVEAAPPSSTADDLFGETTLLAEGGDSLFGDSAPAEPAPPFVTETMAELYLQQGFAAEALEVYRQLSAAYPDDPHLQSRVRKLERGERTSISLEAVTGPGAIPARAAASVSDTIADFEAEPAPMLTARAYFAGLAARRAVQGNGRARATPRKSAPRVSAPVVGSPVAPVAPVAPAASGASLEELFAGGTISDEDERVALAFAQVAGAVEMGAASVKGKPTAPAATELSLDSVFREADARVTGSVPRQSQTLRFDQFFATAGDESVSQQPPAASAPAGPPAGAPGSPAELQQFQSWLTGLKKP